MDREAWYTVVHGVVNRCTPHPGHPQRVFSLLRPFFSNKAPRPAAHRPCDEEMRSSLLPFPSLVLCPSPPF